LLNLIMHWLLYFYSLRVDLILYDLS
jgi:hypothetical protein